MSDSFDDFCKACDPFGLSDFNDDGEYSIWEACTIDEIYGNPISSSSSSNYGCDYDMDLDMEDYISEHLDELRDEYELDYPDYEEDEEDEDDDCYEDNCSFTSNNEECDEDSDEDSTPQFDNIRQQQAYNVYHNLYGSNNLDKYDSQMLARSIFILENPNLTAAKYLTVDGEFLIVQAIQDNFVLPFEFPYEDLYINTTFYEFAEELSIKSVVFVLEIWKWCLETFSPYIDYVDDKCKYALSLYTIPKGEEEKENYPTIFMFIHKHKELIPLIAKTTEINCLIACLVTGSISYGLYEDMFEIYKLMLLRPYTNFRDYFNSIDHVICDLIHNPVLSSKKERYYAEWDGYCDGDRNFGIFLNELYYPVIKKIDDARLQNKLKQIDKTIEKFYVKDEKTLNKLMKENRIRDGYNEDVNIL